jgi:hypothetical protein
MKSSVTRIQLVVGALAIAASACESRGGAAAATAPSAAPPVSASIVQADAAPQPAFRAELCASTTLPSSTFFIGSRRFNLVLTASQILDLSRLTLELNDGSHVGGPSVTFPQAALRTQLGFTRINPGTTSVTLQPQFGCGAFRPTRVSATMWFVDLSGATQTTTAGAPVN